MNRQSTSRPSGVTGYWNRWCNFWAPGGLNSFWWLLFMLPPLLFFQGVIHEGSHGFAAFCCHGDFPAFAPFPYHSINDDGFIAGRTFSGGAGGYRPIPQIIEFILLGMFLLMFLFGRGGSRTRRLLLIAWFVGVCVDLLFNSSKGLYGQPSERADWAALLEGWSRGGIAAITWVMWILILCGPFLWVYFSTWARTEVERAGFWDYRGLAIICLLISFLAICVSLSVKNADIERISFAFLFFFIIQCLSVPWYFVYLILSGYYSS